MSSASLNIPTSNSSDAPRHPWARSAAPFMFANRWRPTIIENVGGCTKRITVRWDLRRVRGVAMGGA